MSSKTVPQPSRHIWQRPGWPTFAFDAEAIGSGRQGHEVVHYTAPASDQVAGEMTKFLACLMQPAPAIQLIQPHYPKRLSHPSTGLSRQLLMVRSAYYDALSLAQRGTLDVTPWVQWFVQTFTQSCVQSQAVVKQALDKARFRLRASSLALNARQNKVLNGLLEAGSPELGGGFLGGMSAEKYSKITDASKATATRDLVDLLSKGLLKVEGVGKAMRYALDVPGWGQPAAAN